MKEESLLRVSALREAIRDVIWLKSATVWKLHLTKLLVCQKFYQVFLFINRHLHLFVKPCTLHVPKYSCQEPICGHSVPNISICDSDQLLVTYFSSPKTSSTVLHSVLRQPVRRPRWNSEFHCMEKPTTLQRIHGFLHHAPAKFFV